LCNTANKLQMKDKVFFRKLTIKQNCPGLGVAMEGASLLPEGVG
jgi:hypothetical protein